MPYVDIAQGSDFASLWYITNSPTGHVSSFNRDKPTIILLHPFFLDSTWLDSQFGDPRLNEDFNLIAFDQRAAGRTLSRPNGKQDSWTDAADLAFACHVRNECECSQPTPSPPFRLSFLPRRECSY
jgi:pimeloyl-ACP methyl ester carboxylesterase